MVMRLHENAVRDRDLFRNRAGDADEGAVETAPAPTSAKV